MLILICDDEPEFRKRVWNDLERALKGATVEFIDETRIGPMLQVLSRRQLEQRDEAEAPMHDEMAAMLDSADVLVVDFDLVRLPGVSGLTGEDLAYLVRCYSTCGVVVSLNRDRDVAFDTRLSDSCWSFSDLSLRDEDLASPGLWAPSWLAGDREFRPWTWRLIPELVETRRRLVETVRGIDESTPVADALGLDASLADRLHPRAVDFIGGSPFSISLGEFVDGSGQALKSKDEQALPDIRARIIVSRLQKWLAQRVVAPQDVLVDAPHLVARLPSRLRGDPSDAKDWQPVTAPTRIVAELGIEHESLASCECALDDWYPVPLWRWHEVLALDGILELDDPIEAVRPPVEFCEDTSNFQPRAGTCVIRTDLGGPFSRRRIARIAGREYQPATRFS